MKRMLDRLSARFVEGFLVLLPVLLSYLLLGGLFDLVMVLIMPLTDLLSATMFPDVWTQQLVAAGTLVALCFLLGLVVETTVGERVGNWVESRILNRFAPYTVLRSLAQRLSGRDVPTQFQPAFIAVTPDLRLLGFVVEEHVSGEVTVFLPLASTPGVGLPMIVNADKVDKLNVPLMDAIGPLFNWGAGSVELLKALPRRETFTITKESRS